MGLPTAEGSGGSAAGCPSAPAGQPVSWLATHRDECVCFTPMRASRPSLQNGVAAWRRCAAWLSVTAPGRLGEAELARSRGLAEDRSDSVDGLTAIDVPTECFSRTVGFGLSTTRPDKRSNSPEQVEQVDLMNRQTQTPIRMLTRRYKFSCKQQRASTLEELIF